MNTKQRVTKIFDNGDTQYVFTKNENVDSVLSTMYTVMKAKGLTFKLTKHPDRIEINNVVKPADIDLSFMDDLTESHTLTLPKGVKASTVQAYIYRRAVELNKEITVQVDGQNITVSKRDNNKPTFMGQLRELVDAIPYGSELTLPEFNKSTASIRTTLNKLPYELSYRNGVVTKYRYRMRKRLEVFTVSDGTKVIASNDNLSVLVDSLIARGILTHEVEGL